MEAQILLPIWCQRAFRAIAVNAIERLLLSQLENCMNPDDVCRNSCIICRRAVLAQSKVAAGGRSDAHHEQAIRYRGSENEFIEMSRISVRNNFDRRQRREHA